MRRFFVLDEFRVVFITISLIWMLVPFSPRDELDAQSRTLIDMTCAGSIAHLERGGAVAGCWRSRRSVDFWTDWR